jgi:hypothetical protein
MVIKLDMANSFVRVGNSFLFRCLKNLDLVWTSLNGSNLVLKDLGFPL